jgi:hypothetical protein
VGAAETLCLHGDMQLAASRTATGGLVLGPLVTLLLSRFKLQEVLAGRRDTVYCRYADYAREAGALLLFLSEDGLDPAAGTASGYLHHCDGTKGCAWIPMQCPLPTVIYDRCFGIEGRAEAGRVRAIAEAAGILVLNHLPKITKLQAFAALAPYPDLAPHLPFTAPLTGESLSEALARFDDLYIKPDALYKGKGVYRLTRRSKGWVLQTRAEWGNEDWFLPDEADVQRALAQIKEPEADYLLQEGLPLATYLGNRFDFRSLVQRNGRGQLQVTGLVARIAPVGSVITSPRSGGQVAPADRVLQDGFGSHWGSVAAELERVSLLLAERLDRHLGPCVELGLDVGVLQDGTVKLIEVNGKPLRVSLERLRDPLITERIARFPIHSAIHFALEGVAQTEGLEQADQARVRAAGQGQGLRLEPIVGVLLGPTAMAMLQGERPQRYRRMVSEAREAGAIPVIFPAEGIDLKTARVTGFTDRDGHWQEVTLPLPDVVYNRSTHDDLQTRRSVAGLLREMADRFGTILINSTNAFGKSQIHEAIQFFAQTADLAPETVAWNGPDSLAEMTERHSAVFLKAEHGSHGSDVLRIRREQDGWQVRGRVRGMRISESPGSFRQLCVFLDLLTSAGPWVLQQGVDLPEIDGRVFDLRAIAQKDGSGSWQVPMVLVRMAQAGNVAANMSLGGEPFTPAEFQRRYGERQPLLEGLQQTATETAVKVALAVEARFGAMGEIGIDLGIDRQGRPWVFEANTKPLHPDFQEMEERLTVLPFRYAVWLARRSWEGRQSGLPTPLRLE